MAQHLLQHQATAGLQISEKLGKFALIIQVVSCSIKYVFTNIIAE